jgi:hypothetical protein
MKDRVVLCIRWGELYSPQCVNVLFRAVSRHLSGPFRFICLTDDPEGLDEGIESFPIPDMGLPPAFYGAGAWPKISIFKRDLHGIEGRILFIDLDTLIFGPLDRYFDLPGDFVAIGGESWAAPAKRRKPRVYFMWKRFWSRLRGKSENAIRAKNRGSDLTANTPTDIPLNRMGTGIFSFDAGSIPHVYDRFIADPDRARQLYTNEQHFVEHQLDHWMPWPPGWVTSFKYSLRQPLVIDLFRPPRRPDPDSAVIAFHGDPRPIDMATRRMSSLNELPHVWFGPVGWVREYWQRYGAQG